MKCQGIILVVILALKLNLYAVFSVNAKSIEFDCVSKKEYTVKYHQKFTSIRNANAALKIVVLLACLLAPGAYFFGIWLEQYPILYVLAFFLAFGVALRLHTKYIMPPNNGVN